MMQVHETINVFSFFPAHGVRRCNGLSFKGEVAEVKALADAAGGETVKELWRLAEDLLKWLDDATIEAPQNVFARMLSGHQHPAEALLDGAVVGDHRRALKVLQS